MWLDGAQINNIVPRFFSSPICYIPYIQRAMTILTVVSSFSGMRYKFHSLDRNDAIYYIKVSSYGQHYAKWNFFVDQQMGRV
jgi:hypothetical protein